MRAGRGRQADRQTGRQRGREAERQRGREAERERTACGILRATAGRAGRRSFAIALLAEPPSEPPSFRRAALHAFTQRAAVSQARLVCVRARVCVFRKA
eukprot:COSAG03_NODE_14134_length_475_cov_1.382979_1_plen_98_part_10